jgi:hypothetical protein
MIIMYNMINIMSNPWPTSKLISSHRGSGLHRQSQGVGKGDASVYSLQSLVFWIAIALSTLMGTANAANWYVQPAALGSNNGTSWSNAWSATSINWSNVHPGDTVWLAGGSYSGLTVGASGTSSSPITINRVTSSDSVPVASPGWSSSFDSQVVFSEDGGNIIELGNVSFVTVDGHRWSPPKLPTTYGILIKVPFNTNPSSSDRGVNMGANCTVRNIEIAGPGYNQTLIETDGIIFSSGCLVSGCKIHDLDTANKSWIGMANTTMEYTTIYNISSSIVSNPGVGPHPDAYYSSGQSTNLVFRYCVMACVVSEAFFFDMGGQTGTKFYGNVFFQGDTVPAGCDAIEVKTALSGVSWGTFFLYNNTFVDWSKNAAVLDGAGSTISASSVVQNNLFVNCGDAFDNANGPAIITQYNGFVPGNNTHGTNASVSTVIPFVSYKATTKENLPTGYDPTPYVSGFAITPGSWPIGKGSDLGPPYDVDMNGNSIGSNLGALAVSGSSPATPPAPLNLRVTGL